MKSSILYVSSLFLVGLAACGGGASGAPGTADDKHTNEAGFLTFQTAAELGAKAYCSVQARCSKAWADNAVGSDAEFDVASCQEETVGQILAGRDPSDSTGIALADWNACTSALSATACKAVGSGTAACTDVFAKLSFASSSDEPVSENSPYTSPYDGTPVVDAGPYTSYNSGSASPVRGAGPSTPPSSAYGSFGGGSGTHNGARPTAAQIAQARAELVRLLAASGVPAADRAAALKQFDDEVAAKH